MTDTALAGPGPAVGSRWWTVALGAIVVACGIIALAGLDGDPATIERLIVSVVAMVAYLLFFVLVVRRARGDSPAAYVSIAVTIVAGGVFTAIYPANASFQFWIYPLVWVLAERVPVAIASSFLVAASVFVGFAVSTGSSPTWWVSATLTQGISFGVSIVLGLWITSIYRYAEERERLAAELTAAQGEVAALHREAGTTAERERLSRELHDTIAQSLAGTVLLAQRSRREFAGDGLSDDTLELLEDAARSALAETRALVAGMAPVELRGGGIAGALGAIAARFTRETDLPVAVAVDTCSGLEREAEVALLRCAQEALANVRRHADAAGVRLELRCVDDVAELRVVDDGCGFDPATATHGFGLAGLRSRIALVGGTVEIDGTPGATTLVARVPRTVVPEGVA
jgi:signal transduction histidine kinase